MKHTLWVDCRCEKCGFRYRRPHSTEPILNGCPVCSVPRKHNSKSYFTFRSWSQAIRCLALLIALPAGALLLACDLPGRADDALLYSIMSALTIQVCWTENPTGRWLARILLAGWIAGIVGVMVEKGGAR